MVLVLEEDLVVEGGGLASWGEGPPCRASAPSPYPPDTLLNSRLVIWAGDPSKLRVDALLRSVDPPTLNDRILSKAGPSLSRELSQLKDCDDGDIFITSGYRLPAKHIFHIVGPSCHSKFNTASENTLHNCYRNVLQKAHEMRLNSVGICVMNTVKNSYSPDKGAHVAIRAVRRFLEQGLRWPGRVILVVGKEELDTFRDLVALYFPCAGREEAAAIRPAHTSLDNHTEIHIIDNPHHFSEDESCMVEVSGYSEMVDQQRLLGEPRSSPIIDPATARELLTKERYDRLLCRAKTEDLSEVSGIGCLYQCGHDRFGRPLIVFVGRWFRFKDINLDKALLYLIYLLDPLVKKDYVIAYFHTNTNNANYPSLTWLKEVYNILPYKYKKNLKAFYIIHPTLWTKMMTWWFTTFMAPAIKHKVHSFPGIEYLYSVVRPHDLEIPAFITEHDMTINGIRYFNYSAAS